MNKKEYPYNLIADVFINDEEREAFEKEFSGQLETIVERIIDEVALSQRNKEIIHARYKDKMTFSKIGEKFGFSRQNAHEVTNTFLQNFKRSRKIKKTKTKKTELLIDEELKKRIEGIEIEVLNLDSRCYNCLKRVGCDTLEDIIIYDYNNNGEWIKIWSFGGKSLERLKKSLIRFGITIGKN